MADADNGEYLVPLARFLNVYTTNTRPQLIPNTKSTSNRDLTVVPDAIGPAEDGCVSFNDIITFGLFRPIVHCIILFSEYTLTIVVYVVRHGRKFDRIVKRSINIDPTN